MKGNIRCNEKWRKLTKSFYYFKILHIKSKRLLLSLLVRIIRDIWTSRYVCPEHFSYFNFRVWINHKTVVALKTGNCLSKSLWHEDIAHILIFKNLPRDPQKDEFVLSLSCVWLVTTLKRHWLMLRTLPPVKPFPMNILFILSKALNQNKEQAQVGTKCFRFSSSWLPFLWIWQYHLLLFKFQPHLLQIPSLWHTQHKRMKRCAKPRIHSTVTKFVS